MFRALLLCCTVVLGLSAARGQDPAPSPGPNNYQPAKVLKRTPVSYPLVARLNRVEGVVKIKFSVDDTGHVKDVTIVSPVNLALDNVVHERTLRDWVFQPALFEGKPIPSSVEQEFEFKLDPAEERALALKRLALPVGLPDPPYPPEAAARKLAGTTTIGVHWTQGDHPGLVDNIYLAKSSGSGLLDSTALKFAYENWRIDPAKAGKEAFEKTVTFKPPQP